jgi:hypothetical protein
MASKCSSTCRESRLGGHGDNLADRFLQRAERVGLAGLLKPTWLSEICRKLKPASAACADPSRLDLGTPRAAPIDAVFVHCL